MNDLLKVILGGVIVVIIGLLLEYKYFANSEPEQHNNHAQVGALFSKSEPTALPYAVTQTRREHEAEEERLRQARREREAEEERLRQARREREAEEERLRQARREREDEEERRKHRLQTKFMSRLTINKSRKFSNGYGYKELNELRTINDVIIIDTHSRTLKKEISGLKSYHVAYNYLIERNGNIHLLVEEYNVAFHTHARNDHSIGIGLMHVSNQRYSSAQKKSLISLLIDIVNRHNISLYKIRANSDIYPKKKSDFSSIRNYILEQVETRL